jgi:uncharacterized coiled-coil protein SlyX
MCESSATASPPCHLGNRRRKLWELEDRFHCPVIGTCLSIQDLEKVVRQSGVGFQARPTDYELHVSLVHMSGQKCRSSKNLQKLLEKRYARHVRRIVGLTEERDLLAEWDRAKVSGDVPGTFWALVTHPAVKGDLGRKLYGEIHMLSHVSGSSHRQALGRIPLLEQRIDELETALRQNQSRSRAIVAERDRHIIAVEHELRSRRTSIAQAEHDCQERASERRLESALSQERHRTDLLEGRLAERAQRLDEQALEIQALKELLAEGREDLKRAECGLKALLSRFSGEESGPEKLPDLNGRHVVYVGGRRSLTPQLRSLVEEASGRFTHHDGGLEDKRAGLERLAAQADFVFCPVDCISHDACLKLKRYCKHRSATFVPLRTASVSHFVSGLYRVSSLGSQDS